jgi:uncharacterized membrane protein YeaQ/YmgE (transglycosylase-associated protein family)
LVLDNKLQRYSMARLGGSGLNGGRVMAVLGWMVFGLIIGAIAKLIMPGRDPGGFIVTMLLGIIGAILGGWLGQVLGIYAAGEPVGYVMATIGAIVLLTIYRMATRRGPVTH